MVSKLACASRRLHNRARFDLEPDSPAMPYPSYARRRRAQSRTANACLQLIGFAGRRLFIVACLWVLSAALSKAHAQEPDGKVLSASEKHRRASSDAMTPPPAARIAAGQTAYQRDVLPLLDAYCAQCHTRQTSEGRWAFDAYPQYADLLTDKQNWDKVQQLVANHIMPPHGETAPAPDQRRRLLEWIDNVVFFVDSARPDPGHTTLRRMNREEYNNTVRDVLAIEGRPADHFPLDDAGYGFDNIADVLSVSSLHFEKYLTAARDIAEEVVQLRAPPRVGVELAADKLTRFRGRAELKDKLMWLNSTDAEVGTTVEVPAPSTYRVLTRAAMIEDGEQLLRIEILCDGRPLAQLAPKAPWRAKPGPMATAFALVSLPGGSHQIALRTMAPQTTSSNTSTTSLGAVQFLGISGPFTPAAPAASPFLQQTLAWDADGARPLAEPVLRLSGEDLDAGIGRSSLDTGRAWFASNGYRHAPVLIQESGTYRLRFKVGAQQVGDEPVKFEVRAADRTIGPFSVTAGSQIEQWIDTTCQLPEGEHDWQVWFTNEYKDLESGVERFFWLHELSIEGPLERAHGLSRDQIVQILQRAARQLFRRPLEKQEAAQIDRLAAQLLEAGHAPSVALQTGLEALLVSPKFLYHPQPRPGSPDLPDGTCEVDEPTLASRLSYFLWSSAPDEELLELAERKQLRSQFATQVRRMIADPKIGRLTANFAGQWLQLRDVAQAAPAQEVFPEFSGALAADMRRESELLFEYILRENRPVLEFLTADYTFINRRLARHYGLPEPSNEGFTKISIAQTPRRGIVTHASVLTLTSHPTRTAPVKRGKWLLEQLLGAVPPPAPANITPLSNAPENESLPLRARLEQHRQSAECAACHALLDPMGFALENYDAIGRWRDSDAGNRIDTAGRLITGESFADWSELRSALVEHRRNDFLRCLTEHLLTYALGRGITYQDKLTVRQIVADSQATDAGFQDLVLAICNSLPFQRMRGGAIR